jgi:excisionase family DNA binding protein
VDPYGRELQRVIRSFFSGKDTSQKLASLHNCAHIEIMPRFLSITGHDSQWKGKLPGVTLGPVADQELSTNEVAARLGVSKPTVRKLLAEGALVGRTELHGSRFVWRIGEGSVVAYLESQGGSVGARRQGKRVTVSQLQEEILQLRAEVRGRAEPGSAAGEDGDLRAELTTLHEALLQQRAVTDAMASADEARAEVVRHLIAAVAASETADQRRREALAASQAIVGQFITPGNTGDLYP